MLSFHRTLSFRYVRQRWSRAVLVIASIALGVATLVATRALNQCMKQATRGAVTPLAGTADLMISLADSGVPGELVDELRRAHIPGLAEIRPLVLARVGLHGLPDQGDRLAMLVGIDIDAQRMSDDNLLRIDITNPLALMPGRRPAFLGSELAGSLPPGTDRLRVRASGKVNDLAILGTIDARGPAASLGGNLIVMRLADAAAVLGKPDDVTRIDLILAPDLPEADRERARARVAEVLVGRANVRGHEDDQRAMHDVMAGLEFGFLLGGVGALVVGLFLVYNALSVTVAERRHDIGILRSLGATRPQVAGLFAVEAAILGLAGAALGVPLGLGLAELARGPIQQVLSDILMPIEAGALSVGLLDIVIAIAAGIATAQAAAIVPAIRAANQEPADAVRRVPLVHGWRLRAVQIAGSGLLILGGALCIAFREYIPAPLGGPRSGSFGGLALVLVGILLATPLLAELAAHLFAPLAPYLLGIEGRLAADNLSRSPGRTGLVIAALAAGAALMFETAGLTDSTEFAILSWVDRSIAADLFVSCNSSLAASGNSQPMQQQVGRDIAALPEVEAVLPIRFQLISFRATKVYLIALDAQQFHDLGMARPGIVGREQFPALTAPGTVICSENFAVIHKLKVGDSVTIAGKHGPLQLRIVGTVPDYTWNRGTLYLDRPRYIREFDDDLVDSFDIYLKPEADIEAVRETIARRWGAPESLVVMTRAELRQTIADVVHRLYALAYAQQIVVGLVAGLGVVTALLISVLQRRRELGLLRAVGASQRQILFTVLAEAVLMGIIGAVIGLLVGLPLEWYAVRVILFEETGFSFPVLVPWKAVGIVTALALTTAILAGLGPAVHAMRQRIAEAIAYE
jgi:putative ABC transport system permease protein